MAKTKKEMTPIAQVVENTMLKIRTRYSERIAVKQQNKLPSRTKQSFKSECDINNIMRKFEKTGILPDLIKQNPRYGDFSEVPDYLAALNTVQKAHEQFESLSAKVRERFANSPERFLAFVTDKSNAAEMRSLGLLKPELKGSEGAPSSSSNSSSSAPAGVKPATS